MTVWPETERAVQTIPAIAITKNIPVVPESPKRRRTTEDTMIVSIVIPETGLREVVAIALAATEVKKNEKASVRRRPTSTTTIEAPRLAKKMPAESADTSTPPRIQVTGMSRSVRSSLVASPCRNARAAMEKEPATTLSDLMIPKMPAVAIAPTPTNRT